MGAPAGVSLKHTKAIVRDFSLVSQIDLAKMAAFVDSEGHIAIPVTKHVTHKFGRGEYEFVSLSVSNTNPVLMQWLTDRFGGRVYLLHRSGPRWKQGFQWNLSCLRAVALLKLLRPFFVLKGEQADIAIACQATMKQWGVKGTPAHVIEQRRELRARLKVLTKRGPSETDQAVNS